MKKLFTIILMAAAILTACTKENNPVANKIVTINATIAGNTKVALGENDETKVNWTEGDVIILTFISEAEYPFKWKEGTTFEYDGDGSAPFIFYEGYPINATYRPVTTGQTGLKADVGKYMALSANKTITTEKDWGDVKLEFTHNTSVLKLTLSNEAFKSQEVTTITLKAGGTVVAKATEKFTGDASGNVTVYFAINPATLNNVTLHAVCGENTYFGTLSNKELTSGKLYNATATLANACFLPNGSTFKTAINTFLGINTSLAKIQFIADPSWTPTGTQIGECGAYMVANTETQTLEIRTATSCFVFNEDCSQMFQGETSWTKNNIGEYITSIVLGDCINTTNVTDMHSMFSFCYALQNITISNNFNTSSVTNMEYMFFNCQKLESLDLSKFNTSNVTNMNDMFGYCYELNLLTFGDNFNTANVADMSCMFEGVNMNNTDALELDLTGFTFKQGVNIEGIFEYNTGPTIVKVTQAGYDFLKDKKTSNITFVKEDGTTPWE